MKRYYKPSPAKLNLGLHILGRWPEGYHILETLIYPYPYLYDDIEVKVLPGKNRLELRTTGLYIPDADENYLHTAYKVLGQQLQSSLPALEVWIHKRIPISAGLGGGSSNAGTFLRLLAELMEPPLTLEFLHKVAARIGSDVPFFLYNRPMLAKDTGTVLEPFDLSLEGYQVFVITPPVPCSTKHIYRALRPTQWSRLPIEPILRQPISEWRHQLRNDLELVSFQIYPTLLCWKMELYAAGAIYASMNGSGSSLYGIFPA
ncbi:MAG: 4-(cytidine 5'-diphospho)-2-C-methyl-D-erythritol kinase [Bacteroidia bacterium]